MSHRRSCHHAATRHALRDTLLPLRTLSSSVHSLRADAGSSRSSSRPGSDRVRVRDCRTRASTGYRTALPRRPDQTDCTTAADSRCATSRRSETLDGRLENPPSDNAARSLPAALTTAPPPPSRLEHVALRALLLARIVQRREAQLPIHTLALESKAQWIRRLIRGSLTAEGQPFRIILVQYQLSTVKGLSVPAWSVALHSAQSHKRAKGIGLKPALLFL